MFNKKINFLSLGIIFLMFLFSFSTFAAKTTKKTVTQKVVSKVPSVKIHYQRTDKNYDNMTVWAWEGAVGKSTWPEGYAKSGADDFGIYYEIPLLSNKESKIGFLFVNSKTGAKDGNEDRFFDLSKTKEVWVYQGQKVEYYSKPKTLAKDEVRVHYNRKDKDYKTWSLWAWNDVVFDSSKGWPNGLKSSGENSFGTYFDVKVSGNSIGMKPANTKTGDGEGGDRTFKKLDMYRELFIMDENNNVYVTADLKIPEGIEKAEVISDNTVKLSFSTAKFDEKALKIIDKKGKNVELKKVTKNGNNVSVEVGKIDETVLPYSVVYDGSTIDTVKGVAYVDSMYAYNGNDLGATLNADGTAILKVWSPLVKDVKVVLYDKADQTKIVADDIQMVKGDRGIWSVVLNEKNSGVKNLNAYYYQYKVDAAGDGSYKLALDPYAKSMAAWNSKEAKVGKSAILNPSNIGPKLSYASIPGFKKREDAIIYEVNVRDLTVDPSIEKELKSKFGTFKALIDKLPYMKDLGVTHIQLMPIMSFYYVDELGASTREMKYSSGGNNYNWGYDPYSYFSATGMYSENPKNPEQRVAELKELIDAVHKNGMAVTLDVVYNHTGNKDILNNVAPDYYYRPGTNASGCGNDTASENAMMRKIIVDSLVYWTKEYKVDGFRFDLMGIIDTETLQNGYAEVAKINPNTLFIGEGWRMYSGPSGTKGADQDWMTSTDSVGVFSDEFRNELKSGYGSEGQPRFLTGGKRNIGLIFDNIKGQPRNYKADDSGDVVQYIEAHDNLTLHDVIAQSIKKDPELYEEEIHRRIRIGNAVILTSQGISFLQAGQEYGRTKQWLDDNTKPKSEATIMKDKNEKLFKHPYFVHNSYDASDAVNMFDWDKATNTAKNPINTLTRAYTKGLMELRKSTDAFRLGSKELVDSNVKLIYPAKNVSDSVIAYTAKATDGQEYYIFINADEKEREFSLSTDLTKSTILVDEKEAGAKAIVNPKGITVKADKVTLAPLTFVVIKK